MKSKTTNTSEKAKIDLILQRTAWVAQITLFIVAILGYFLTVRPVYQKQLLDEQIAERTIKLRESEKNLAKLTIEETELKKEKIRLTDEATKNYFQLRKNLIGQLSTIGANCAFQSETLKSGVILKSCVTKYISRNITAFLKPDDTSRIFSLLDQYSSEIVELPSKVSSLHANRLKNARTKQNNLQASQKSNKQELFTEIAKLRNLSKDEADKIHSINDLVSLQSREENMAYLNYLSKQNKIVDDLNDVSVDILNAESDVSFELSEALDKVMNKIYVRLIN